MVDYEHATELEREFYVYVKKIDEHTEAALPGKPAHHYCGCKECDIARDMLGSISRQILKETGKPRRAIE